MQAAIACLLAIALALATVMIMPSVLSSSWINGNTAATMLFGIESPEKGWTADPEYTWHRSDDYADHVDEDTVDLIYTSFDAYDPDLIASGIADALIEKSQIFEAVTLDTKELSNYIKEFMRIQAAHLIGDSSQPIPKTSEITESIDKMVGDANHQELSSWYESNKETFNASVKAMLLECNDMFTEEALNDSPEFAEAALTLKILNLQILLFVFLAIAIILAFIYIKCCKSEYKWFILSGSQILACIASAISFRSMSDIKLVVLGSPYGTTSIMISDVLLEFWVVFGIQLAITIGLIAWSVYQYIKKKRESKLETDQKQEK